MNGAYNFVGLYTKGEYDENGYLKCYYWKGFFRKCVCMMFMATVIITYMFSFDCNIVKADEWDDAVKYYSNYGNAAVFKATNKMNGNIYFCSAGITSTSGTKYRTIGYKMTIKGTGGNAYRKFISSLADNI